MLMTRSTLGGRRLLPRASLMVRKPPRSRELPIGVFWIIKNVCNLNRFAFQQNAANYTAAPRFK